MPVILDAQHYDQWLDAKEQDAASLAPLLGPFPAEKMRAYPSVDESLGRLHRAGWSVGDAAFGPEHALVWYVSGANGENRIEASGTTRAEAYWRACCQAREVGMLAPALRAEDRL
jgi:hypothetical protein